MTKEHKKLAYFVGALVVIALLLHWLYNREVNNLTEAGTPADSSDFTSPYGYPSPGNYPGSAQGFNSTINVNVDNPLLGALSYQYIPVFGLVGLEGVQG